ncbi:hypothetical protein DevBK_18645 [Devosia sp. BK]|uniref:hypothetical protein n=1 Tax=Devosia sp. BK TaxID=2871706 RepID=UPI00293A5748|nr:hypothetical protein [Devosia sp. BK]MDV3253360.1 hypothetical protein [Devosia sp. BK]
MREPDLFADVSFYSPQSGGRIKPIPSGLGFPCKASETAPNAWDARLYFEGAPIQAGETRRVGLLFLTTEGEQAIRNAQRFFIWETRIIGEATVCTPEADLSP